MIFRRLEYRWDCLRAHTIIKCSAAFWALHCALYVQCCLVPTGQDIRALYVLCSMFLSSCLSYVHISALTLGSSICQAYVCDWSVCVDGTLHWNVDFFNLHVASNQFNVSMGTWLHLWIFTVSAWHIDAAQNGCSYQNIKHAKHTQTVNIYQETYWYGCATMPRFCFIISCLFTEHNVSTIHILMMKICNLLRPIKYSSDIKHVAYIAVR